MIRDDSVMAGCRFQCAMSCAGKSGALPYSAMPGRTQSALTGRRPWPEEMESPE